VQRYLRQLTTAVVGSPSAASGPRTWRSRSPWPCSPTAAPIGRLALPHPGHRAGRASATDGGRASHPLTSSAEWMMCEGRLVVFVNGGRPGARRRPCSSTVGVTYFRRAPSSAPERSWTGSTPAIRISAGRRQRWC